MNLFELELPIYVARKEKMEAYMRNKFSFCGVQTKERKELSKELLKKSRLLETKELITLIFFYYLEREEREYQYIASDLALENYQKFKMKDIIVLSQLISEKSWWDSVDSLRKFFGLWALQNEDQLDEVFNLFYSSEDFWMRRVGINLQLMYKEQTRIDLLEKSIVKDRETQEFFIQKAIGWSLRQYSKTNPEWVKEMFEKHRLSPLAVREGSKYL